MATLQDAHIAEFISANTDPAKPVEARYLDGLRMFADRARELHEALRILRMCLDADTSDCVDNFGRGYQSASLAGAMAFADKILEKKPTN